MKKILGLLVLALGVSNFATAQAYEGKVKYKKEEKPAIVMVYNYPEDIVESALKARLADMRLKGDNSKGFIRYNNAVISSISSTPLDYSFRIEESGKRDKKASTVYLVMEGTNVISGDAAAYASNGKAFLESLAPNVEKSNTIFQIKSQEEILVKEEKRLKNLKDDQESLEKKLKENKNDQEKQQKIITSQRSILDDLKAKN